MPREPSGLRRFSVPLLLTPQQKSEVAARGRAPVEESTRCTSSSRAGTRPADAVGPRCRVVRWRKGIPAPCLAGAGPLQQPARREYASCRQQVPLSMGLAVLAVSGGRRARPPGRSAPERSPGGLAARIRQCGGSLRSRFRVCPPPAPVGGAGRVKEKGIAAAAAGRGPRRPVGPGPRGPGPPGRPGEMRPASCRPESLHIGNR